MISSDAHTNPYLRRGCSHIFEDATVTPRRCLACGAVDHGACPIGPMARGGMAGYRLGGYPFGSPDELAVTSPTCPQGHPLTIERLTRATGDVIRRRCPTCAKGSLEERMARPCINGHVGRWSARRDRGLRCLECHTRSARRAAARERGDA